MYKGEIPTQKTLILEIDSDCLSRSYIKRLFSHLIHFIDFLKLLSSDCAVQTPIGSIFFLN